MATKQKLTASIGKFDILATYTYTKAVLDGATDTEAKERGMVAAIMGAKARSGHAISLNDYQTDKTAAERKKKTTITAQSFDRQVADKMGAYFEKAFLPRMKRLVEAEMSYDEVKRLVGISAMWGAKITGEQFEERTAARKSRKGKA